MPASIIDGKAIAASIREGAAVRAAEYTQKTDVPGLGRGHRRGESRFTCIREQQEEGLCAVRHLLRRTCASGFCTEDQLLDLVRSLNDDPNIDGILVQLPLPDHINEAKVIETIDPAKDVDGFHPINVGNLMIGRPCLRPCTPAGVMELIKRAGVELKGKRATVVGRSNIVGKPVSLMLLAEHATVTICHSRTQDLPAVCREADVLVVAVGRPEMVRGDWIRPGAVVIDVGINRLPDKKLVGDVAFDEAVEVASAITPVPGGVGPMTIAMLMNNCLDAAFALRG